MTAVRKVCIGDFLNKSHNWVEPKPDETYKQITVRLWGKGLTLRAEVSGSQIAAARQLKVKAKQFLLSRIDARHGAFGIVPASLDSALVSNDFPCFDIDLKIALPTYFAWYARTTDFIDLCRQASKGSTNRVRLKEEEFLRMTVLLPPLDEQQWIVAKLNRVVALVEERKKVIEAAKHGARLVLSNAFRQIIDGVPYRPMSKVAPLVRRPVEVSPDESYPELGVRSFGRGTFHKPPLIGSRLTWQKLFLIQEGDLVFSNIKAWEGAFAVAQSEDHNRVGSHRYLTCVPVEGVTTTSFIWFYLQSQEGLAKVAAASPGSADRNRTLGQKSLGAIKIPVPPIDRQHWFDRLQMQVYQVEVLRESAGQDVAALLPAMLHGAFKEGKSYTPD